MKTIELKCLSDPCDRLISAHSSLCTDPVRLVRERASVGLWSGTEFRTIKYAQSNLSAQVSAVTGFLHNNELLSYVGCLHLQGIHNSFWFFSSLNKLKCHLPNRVWFKVTPVQPGRETKSRNHFVPTV